ncbi:MAG: hypothetical protein ACOY0T_27780 [Myxococcota bacterium]
MTHTQGLLGRIGTPLLLAACFGPSIAGCTLTDYGYLQSGLEDGADRTRVTLRACAAGRADDTYVPTSPYLLEAEPNVDYVVSCARFWFKARAESGGYYTKVAQDGTPDTAGPREPMSQSRDAYGFVRAFMLSGDEEFLEHAEYALDYLYSVWRESDGGWYSDHSSFFEHYALLGPSAFCQATFDPKHCGWRDTGEALLDEKLWDSNPKQFGYYDLGGLGWKSPSGKSFNATVDALGTHDYPQWLADPASREQRLFDVGENILTRFVPLLGTNTNGFGFPDRFGTDWGPAPSYTNFSGHVLKASWNLSRFFMITGEERWRTGAEQTIEEVLKKVWNDSLDHRMTSQGGGTPEWWELEQGFTSGILAYYNAATPELRARYLELADESVAAFHRVYDDPVYGDAFKTPSRAGAKGDTYKAGYHTTETGYYSLLYGQLLYRHRPVSLYYRIRPAAEARSIRLTPIYSPRLRITDVTLDGAAYTAFGATKRQLDIPAGTGGIFKVTFWIDDTPGSGATQPCTLADP